MDKLETAVSVKDDEERVHYSKPSVYILTCQRIEVKCPGLQCMHMCGGMT